MPTLATKEYCSGCTACASACPKGCIVMSADKNGFLYPMIDENTCIDCGLCEKLCPIVSPLNITNDETKAYAAYSKDETIRFSSSSGGIFTELANIILQHGGAVFGAIYNEQFEVVHTCVENENELAKLRGAKYSQSDLQGIFEQIRNKLEAGQSVLFAGTPCQVGGLKSFLRKEYDNLLTVDFVCNSVPSPMAWREYVKYRSYKDNNGELPTFINLRSKATGWSRYQYSNHFEYSDGSTYTVKSSDSLYMKLFIEGFINRQSCRNCKFKGYNRVSDITLGDFWGIWDISPDFDDDKGTSVILVHSHKGSELFEKISEKILAMPVTLEETSLYNSAILKSSTCNEMSQKAFYFIRNGDFFKCSEFFVPKKTSLLSKIVLFFKRIGQSGDSSVIDKTELF